MKTTYDQRSIVKPLSIQKFTINLSQTHDFYKFEAVFNFGMKFLACSSACCRSL